MHVSQVVRRFKEHEERCAGQPYLFYVTETREQLERASRSHDKTLIVAAFDRAKRVAFWNDIDLNS